MLRRLLPDTPSPKVKAEQIRLLYDQGTTIQLLGIATGCVAVYMFWGIVDHAQLLLWLSVHLLLTLARLLLNHNFKRVQTRTDNLDRWGHFYVIGTFLSGLVWGSLCLFLDPSWPPPDQIILFAIYTGIIAGAFNTNTPYFIAFPAFYLPPVLWLCYTMLQQRAEGFATLITLFGIYIVLMYVSALKFHARLNRSLLLRFENEGLANRLAHSNVKLATLADTDELTGLRNRRAMFKRLNEEWNRHHRARKPLTLMYLDIDCFKQYNDTYGHECGDQCMVRIAQLLQDHAQRSSDLAARFGGEEFALILPETSLKEAEPIAASILQELHLLQIPHATSTVAGHTTISIGIAALIPDRPDNDIVLRQAADEALYKAKNSGRNRFIVSPDSHDYATISA